MIKRRKKRAAIKVKKHNGRTFHKGDKVMIVNLKDKNNSVRLPNNSMGIVLKYVKWARNDRNDIPIFWGPGFKGHNCEGLSSENHSYYMSYDEIKYLGDENYKFKIETKSFIKDFKPLLKKVSIKKKSVEKYIKKSLVKSFIYKDLSNIKLDTKSIKFLNDNYEMLIDLNKNSNKDELIKSIFNIIEHFDIKRIGFGNSININDWQDKMTLLILPEDEKYFMNINVYNPLSIKKAGRKNFKFSYGSIEFNKEAKSNKNIPTVIAHKIEKLYYINIMNTILYIPQKNITIMLTNPFVNNNFVYKRISVNEIKHQNNYGIEYKYISKEDSLYFVYNEIWGYEIKSSIYSNRNNINSINYDMDSLSERYNGLLEKRKEVNVSLRHDMNIMKNNNLGKEIKNNVDKISKLVFVKDIEIKEYIKIDIGKLYIPYNIKTGQIYHEGIAVPRLEKKSIYIGDMYIKIYPDRIFVSSKERDKQTNKYSHPHVNHEGVPCFGNIRLKINDMLKNMEYYDLTKLLYSWITSYNKEDPYIIIEDFHGEENEYEYD